MKLTHLQKPILWSKFDTTVVDHSDHYIYIHANSVDFIKGIYRVDYQSDLHDSINTKRVVCRYQPRLSVDGNDDDDDDNDGNDDDDNDDGDIVDIPVTVESQS